MTEITGRSIMTLNVSDSEEISKITYETSKSVDILNNTSEDMAVSVTGDFDENEYFVIPGGGAYNNFCIGSASGAAIYIKTVAAGKISLICGRY